MKTHRYPGLFGAGGEKTLWLAVAASMLLHVGLFGAFGRHRIAPLERTFFAPIHMVELGPQAPPGGGARAQPGPPPAPVPAPQPKAEPKPAPPPEAETVPAPPKEAPKPKAPAAAPKPQPKPTEKVVPATPRDPAPPKETRTEEQVAERIARLREKLDTGQTPAPAAPSPRAGVGDAKVRQAVESIRDRLQPAQGSGAGAGTAGAGGAAGIRGASGNVLQEVRLRSYYNRLWEHVNSHWAIPPSLQGRGHTVIVSAVLDRRGGLLRSFIEEPSASPAFDQSALRALERAAPLPPFPEEVREDVLEVGFRFHGE